MDSDVDVSDVTDVTVLALLHQQHTETRRLLSRVADSYGPERQAAFDALLRLLAVHEAAEDLVLRPAGRLMVPRQVAVARAGEERQIAQMIGALERLDTDGGAFDSGFAAVTEALVTHLWFEEAEEWPTLETRWTPEQQLRLGAWVARAVDRAAARAVSSAATAATAAGVGVGSPGDLAGDGIGRPEGWFGALCEDARDLLTECRDEPPWYFETAGHAGSRGWSEWSG